MKTKTIVTLMSCGLLIITNKSFSQHALNNKGADFFHPASLTSNTDFKAGANVFNLNAVARKVQRSFASYFGENAENNWSMVGKNFLNRFHANGLLTNALFTKNGRLIYTITYGTEKNLPVDIRKIVKSKYYDYTITMAIEVKESNRDIWIVKLDNTNEQITVRVEDSEMEQVQQFKKSTN